MSFELTQHKELWHRMHLGIDPSPNSTGVAIGHIVNGQYEIEIVPAIRPDPKSKRTSQKERDQLRAIEEICESHNNNFCAGLVEGHDPLEMIGGKINDNPQLAIVSGILRLLKERNIPGFTLTPEKCKRAYTGDPKASKIDVWFQHKENGLIVPRTKGLDESDAVAIVSVLAQTDGTIPVIGFKREFDFDGSLNADKIKRPGKSSSYIKLPGNRIRIIRPDYQKAISDQSLKLKA